MTASNRFVAWPGHAWLGLAARVYLGVVFLMACVHKIAHPEVFALDIAAYDFLPTELVNGFAIILPWVELVVGVMVVVGFRARAATLLMLLMLVSFIIPLAVALARGLDLSCGCFAPGVGEADPISGWTLVRDGSWLALCLYVLFLDRVPLGLDALLARRRRATL
ncbi:MAG: DoxX family membrane protein [Deltaproteobacteria bacterium]|nr:MAG: DoxX family membrane protein [Deltaproteobacteria bacterium]